MSDFEKFHASVVETVRVLNELNPAEGSSEAMLRDNLTLALAHYERAKNG